MCKFRKWTLGRWCSCERGYVGEGKNSTQSTHSSSNTTTTHIYISCNISSLCLLLERWISLRCRILQNVFPCDIVLQMLLSGMVHSVQSCERSPLASLSMNHVLLWPLKWSKVCVLQICTQLSNFYNFLYKWILNVAYIYELSKKWTKHN